MSVDERPNQLLSPEACRDPEALRSFVQAAISVNAWPIHSRVLRGRILETGLDLRAAREFDLSLAELEDMMAELFARSRRAERFLGISNAFHTPLHNFEVLLRLLVLEWPNPAPMPEAVRRAPYRVHRSVESIRPVLLELAGALLERGIPGSIIARDALAALGHDFGHSGGTDRVDPQGRPAPLSQEDAAEKHVAKFGLSRGYPAALVLESLAGIRATTFFSRPGRERIVPDNEFERRLTLADVMGCVLPPDEWLTHVSVPVLKEKIPGWRRRMEEIAAEQAALRERQHTLLPDDPELVRIAESLETLAVEDARMIRDLGEWFHSERGFFLFIGAQKLSPVAGATALWGHSIDEKVALIDQVRAREDLLAPLNARGFEFLAAFADAIANAESLGERLGRSDIDPRLRQLLAPFVESGRDAAC